MKQETLQQLLADRAAKRPVVLATHLETGEERLIYPSEADDEAWPMAEARKAVMADRSRFAMNPEGEPYFLHVFNPPLRLIVIGAVHIAQPLSRLASLAGYEVIIVDPRAAFATVERFPGVTLINDWPDEALPDLGIDHRTAVVALTHDPKLDDPALRVALASEAFYVGALGSKKTHANRLERLKKSDAGEEALARIHGPVGLDIGATSPAEIALSIMAEITQVLRT